MVRRVAPGQSRLFDSRDGTVRPTNRDPYADHIAVHAYVIATGDIDPDSEESRFHPATCNRVDRALAYWAALNHDASAKGHAAALANAKRLPACDCFRDRR